MDATLKAFLLLFAGAILAYGFGRVARYRDRKSDKVLQDEKVAIEEVVRRDRRIEELEKDVQILQANAEAQTKAAIPIEAAMQAMLIHKLTNDHTPEADALLKKVANDTLTPDDAIKFAETMKDRETDTDERIGEAQQLAAKILPDVIRLNQLAEEASSDGRKTVMVTVPETETTSSMDGGTQEKEKGN